MEQRRGLGFGELGGEVVAEPPGEHEVDHEDAGGHRVDCEIALSQRREDECTAEHGDDEDEARRRQQSAGPPSPERRERQRAGRRQLLEQQAGDQEAGKDEEHVHPDEAALEGAEAQVEQDDRHDGEGPEPLDVWPELVVGDAVQLLAHGTSSRHVGRHPVA